MSTGTDTPLGSRLPTRVREAIENSRVAEVLRRGRRLVADRWQPLRTALSQAYTTSAVYRFGRWIVHTTRHSFTYRWLTKEPEPEVVVVDLRETWTVGPVIRLLERLGSTGPARRVAVGMDSIASVVGRPIRRAPVRVASIVILGFAATALALTWSSAGTAVRLAWLGVLTVAVLGLRVDASWHGVADSRVGTALRALFEPPPSPDEGDDSP